ncbi:MAG: hypothetical protein V3U36_02985 [Anaerolineales bacterium]
MHGLFLSAISSYTTAARTTIAIPTMKSNGAKGIRGSEYAGLVGCPMGAARKK